MARKRIAQVFVTDYDIRSWGAFAFLCAIHACRRCPGCCSCTLLLTGCLGWREFKTALVGMLFLSVLPKVYRPSKAGLHSLWDLNFSQIFSCEIVFNIRFLVKYFLKVEFLCKKMLLILVDFRKNYPSGDSLET